MTRQKKEIIKKITYLENLAETVSEDIASILYEEISSLGADLASLRGFRYYFEMIDNEWCCYMRAQCSCEAEYKEWLRDEYGY